MLTEDQEIEAAQLRAEYRWHQARRAKLLRHPDCRDPGHPGCSECYPEEEPTDEDEERE